MMNKFYKHLCNFELGCAMLCLVVSVTIIFISALSRSFGMPINWALDIALLLFTWSTFLSGDIAFRHNKLVNVDIFINKFPKALQNFIKLICYILIIIVLLWLTYLGIVLCYKSSARSFQGIPGFSYSWVTLSIPVSFTLMSITTFRKVYFEYIKKEKQEIF